MNFLEQIVAEWYAYKGYFVRTNIKFGKLRQGGWKGEIDVAAYNPQTKDFVHIETSTDADSWPKRKERFRRKFRNAAKYYCELFPFKINKIQKIALVGFSKPKIKPSFGDSIKVVLLPEFFREITNELRKKNPMQVAIPENYPLLRAIQFAIFYSSKK
jgi:Holliday junction resolvase-like predicted endonuclease